MRETRSLSHVIYHHTFAVIYSYLCCFRYYCQCLRRLIDIVWNSPLGAFVKQLTVTLRRGVFVRLMNQRCIQQPNRCCSPPVSREMPTVSCTGHLAPWCLSLFIVRGFPITRAGRGHFLSTLSTERCVHNACRCHGAREAESGPCSAWSCLDSWTEARGKERETEQESLERIWSSSDGMIHKFEQGLWAAGVMLIYGAFKVVWFYITALCGLRQRKRRMWTPLQKTFKCARKKSQRCLCRLHILCSRSSRHSLQSVQENFTSYFLSCDIEGSRINAGEMEQWMKKGETDRQNESISSLTEESSHGNM